MHYMQEFKKALQENNPKAIEKLLQSQMNPSFKDNYAICYAAEKGYKDIVVLLMNDKRINPFVRYAKPLRLAAKNGHTQVAELFIFNNYNREIYDQTEGIVFKKRGEPKHPFIWAVENGFTDIVRLFIEKDIKDENISVDKGEAPLFQSAYRSAVVCEKVNIVALLLDDDRVVPNLLPWDFYYGQSPLVLAIKTRNRGLIKLLLNDDRINPSNYDNAAFNVACEFGYVDIVDLLFSYGVSAFCKARKMYNSYGTTGKVDDKFYVGLYKAIKNKHLEVVKRILLEPNIPLKAVFQWSVEENFYKIIPFLLEKINPEFSKSICFREAAKRGHYSIVKILLKDNRILPQALGNQALRSAAKNGHVDVVKLLIRDKRVNPSARENEALKNAAANGRTGVVKALLNCRRLDITKGGYEAVKSAISVQHGWMVIELFFKDGRVNLDGLELEIPCDFKGLDSYKKKYLYESLVYLLEYLPWTFEKLMLNLEKRNLNKNDKNELIVSKLLNTCGLFHYAEPSLPMDISKVIAQNMINICSQ